MSKKTILKPETVCQYIVETGSTVRQAATHFGIGKSTVHSYCQRCNDKNLQDGAYAVLALNLAARSKRGGESTKRRWEALRNGTKKD